MSHSQASCFIPENLTKSMAAKPQRRDAPRSSIRLILARRASPCLYSHPVGPCRPFLQSLTPVALQSVTATDFESDSRDPNILALSADWSEWAPPRQLPVPRSSPTTPEAL